MCAGARTTSAALPGRSWQARSVSKRRSPAPLPERAQSPAWKSHRGAPRFFERGFMHSIRHRDQGGDRLADPCRSLLLGCLGARPALGHHTQSAFVEVEQGLLFVVLLFVHSSDLDVSGSKMRSARSAKISRKSTPKPKAAASSRKSCARSPRRERQGESVSGTGTVMEATKTRLEAVASLPGTDGSNPFRSSGESVNFRSLSRCSLRALSVWPGSVSAR